MVKRRNKKGYVNHVVGFSPNPIVNQTMVGLSLGGNSNKVRENIGPGSEH